MRRKRISGERKASYYFGLVLMVAGFITFGSVFITNFADVGNFGNFDSRMKSSGIRAILGMGMIIVGGFLRRVGVRGVAGSGVILDPEQARRDVEPWSRMAGGMARDALDEADIDLGKRPASQDLPFDEKLRRLHRLHEDGILSTEEYEREKREILDNN